MRELRILFQTRDFLFPPDQILGPDFQEEIRRGALRGLRIASWMALVAGVLFVALDILALPRNSARLLSLLTATGLGLAGIPLSYTPLGQKYPRCFSVLSALLIASCLAANQWLMGAHTYGHSGGLTIILLVMAALGTLQPFWVLLSGAYFFLLYLMIGFGDPTVGWPPPATFLLPSGSLLLSATISVWLAAARHRSRRNEFLLRRQLAKAFSDLRATQAQLLASEKAITQSQVVAALSHELNNPLGVVVSNLSTQENLSRRLREKWSASQERAEEINRLLSIQRELNHGSTTAVQRMASLIDRLREFSHLDQSVTQSVDLNGELLKALEMVKSETQATVQVESQLSPLPELICQPQKLSMAFATLLRNAFEAVGQDGIVRLSTNHSNRQIEVLIEDNGRGMDPDELRTIFDPKFIPQAGKVRTSWGLAISQQIFLQHAGHLELESTLGKGTIARVRLPLAD